MDKCFKIKIISSRQIYNAYYYKYDLFINEKKLTIELFLKRISEMGDTTVLDMWPSIFLSIYYNYIKMRRQL